MLAPEMVERLQQHRAFSTWRMMSGPKRSARSAAALVGGLGDALADLLVGDAFFLGPVLDRQVEVEDVAATSSCRPAASHCSA